MNQLVACKIVKEDFEIINTHYENIYQNQIKFKEKNREITFIFMIRLI